MCIRTKYARLARMQRVRISSKYSLFHEEKQNEFVDEILSMDCLPFCVFKKLFWLPEVRSINS